MANSESTTMQGDEPVIAISYGGEKARTDADQLAGRLQVAGVVLESPSEISQEDARLGAGELIITLVASAAARAVISAALQYVEDYLVEQVEKKAGDLNVQVAVRKPGAKRAERFIFSTAAATVEIVRNLFQQVRDSLFDL